MNKVYFAIGLHFHQPVGNLEEIIERVYKNSYKPFLKALTKYPNIKMTFHLSGNLLDYFEKRHPEFLDEVSVLIARGQVEIMSGGYYEPIFQAIPREDRLGQIEMMNGYYEKRFGIRPKGMWIPERVWSPELVEDFRRSKMKYSILDDTHFIKAGFKEEELYGYFTTGANSSKMAIFPSDKTLRYIIPFKPPRETIDYFRRVAKEKKEPLFTYGDDAEKFGEWPFTYNWVYKKGWLDNFLKELTRNQNWIKMITFSEFLDLRPPLKDVDIPEASYEEMLEWSGGSWMNFLSRYPESDQMHKRMVYVSRRIGELRVLRGGGGGRKKKIEEAEKELYRAQTNCPYWHGVFGGIYLYHLRRAVYKHLICAERIADEIEHDGQNDWLDMKEVDFYNRGVKAVILENRNFFICIDPARGGVIRELDYKMSCANLINTLARRNEPYHKKIRDRINNKLTTLVEGREANRVKTLDRRIKKGIFYDRHTRSCLVDHFINKDLKREDFSNSNYTDMGDFVEAPYIFRREKEKVILVREGKVKDKAMRLTKKIYISSNTEIEIMYVLKNKSPYTIDAFFGMEFNIGMPHADSDRYSYYAGRKKLCGLDKASSLSESGSFSIRDSKNELGVKLIFSERPEKIWYFPVMTVSQSERAYNFNYQASCIFPMWDIKLKSGEGLRLGIRWGNRGRSPINYGTN